MLVFARITIATVILSLAFGAVAEESRWQGLNSQVVKLYLQGR